MRLINESSTVCLASELLKNLEYQNSAYFCCSRVRKDLMQRRQSQGGFSGRPNGEVIFATDCSAAASNNKKSE
jgi:hypothetical protein